MKYTHIYYAGRKGRIIRSSLDIDKLTRKEIYDLLHCEDKFRLGRARSYTGQRYTQLNPDEKLIVDNFFQECKKIYSDQYHNPLYCNCDNPNIILSHALHKSYQYCRTCKKEKL